jgi:uncharacterized membrane protein YqiK
MNTLMPVFLVTVSDMLCGFVILGFVLSAIVIYFKVQRRQALCKHERGVRETSSCDAICNQCGKNLGFISLWRKEHSKV